MQPYRIIALGDSLTYGYPFGKRLSWVELTAQALGVPILNQGINGNTLGEMLRRLTTDVLDLHPEFCVILGGTNDIYQGASVELMKSNFTKLTDRILENKILPVLGLPPPTKDSAHEKELGKFRNWLKRHAKAYSLKFIDFYHVFMDAQKKRLLPNFLEDGVHPSAKAYEAMAGAAIKVLKPLVEG